MKLETGIRTFIIAALLTSPFCQADGSSGMATGKRQHGPITIVKPIDKATPKLMQAMRQPQTDASSAQRAAYRLCPDGTMIQPGEKCPEKTTKR